MTGSLINYFTTFESTNNLPMNIEIGHGESADLVASFKDEGIDVALSGYTAMAIFQPKSKWGTDEWYECPCEIVDNTVITHWNYASDNGDSAVKLFIYASKDGVIAYPAIYQIKLFNTPGFDPHPIAPVPKIIDFSQYTLLNAPWVETEDYTSDIAEIRSDITDLDGVAVKSIEYTGSNKIQVKQFLQANPNAVVIWKAGGLGTMTQNIFSKTGDDGEYWTYSCFDASTNQWAWFRVTTDFEITVDFILYKSDVPTIEDSTLSATYSATPRFTDWNTGNYTFTVEWRNNLSSWVFIFNETLINDNTEGWTDPLATHLESDYDGIGLEANRERIDIGYVLGSQTSKPLQPMGDYANSSVVSALQTTVAGIESDIANVESSVLDNIVKLTPGSSSPSFILRNRKQLSLTRGEYYSFTPQLTLPLPDHENYTIFYCILDIRNIGTYSSDAVISLIQPEDYTWDIFVDNGSTLSGVLTVPADSVARYYITQVGGYGSGAGGNWEGLYIRRVLLENTSL